MAKIIMFTRFYNNKKKNTKGDNMCKELLTKIRSKSKGISDMPVRANDVLDYFQVKDFSKGVPIIEILTKFGFKIYQSDLEPEGMSAYIAVDPKLEEVYESNKITCVNLKDNIGHKRFALAHELAHYLFDFDENHKLYYYNTYFPNRENDNLEEKRANQFAANLLMPENIFRNKLKEYNELQSKPDIVNALGQYFRVSSTAVLRRFNELGIGGYDE